MVRYHFSLAKILDYRKRIYQQSIWQFIPLSRERDQLEGEKNHLEREIDRCFSPDCMRITGQDFRLGEWYYHSLCAQKVYNQQKKDILQPCYLRGREEVLRAFQNVDFIEKLAKSSFDAYKRKREKKEKNSLDDVTLFRYVVGGKN